MIEPLEQRALASAAPHDPAGSLANGFEGPIAGADGSAETVGSRQWVHPAAYFEISSDIPETGLAVRPGDRFPSLVGHIYSDPIEGSTYPAFAIEFYIDDMKLGEVPYTYQPVPHPAGGVQAAVTLDENALANITFPTGLSFGRHSLSVRLRFASQEDRNAQQGVGTVWYRPPPPATMTIVDAMVVYTPAASAALGGDQAIRAAIRRQLDFTNAALLNSLIDVQVRLVYVGPIDYVEGGSAQLDLQRLAAPHDGYLDDAHALRDRYAADLVQLWSARGISIGERGCGNIGGRSGDAGKAFSVVVAPNAEADTMAHEFGHNFGAGHARGDEGGTLDDGLFPYSHGYHLAGGIGERDIMAYGPRGVPIYSTPLLQYGRRAVGSATEDNARTIRETAANVAAYRGAAPADVGLAIAGLAAAPQAVSRRAAFRLSATGVTGTAPTVLAAAGKSARAAAGAGAIRQVIFYRDSDGDGAWSPADTVLGTDRSPAGGWTLRGSAAKLPPGDSFLFARAIDAAGRASDAVRCIFRVDNAAPEVTALTVRPGRAGAVTVFATARDTDGPKPTITAWLDEDGDDLLDPGEIVLTGRGAVRKTWTLATGTTYHVAALARDADGAQSAVTTKDVSI